MKNPKTLIIIFGPPAVGKMTVGAELSRMTGFPLFHNHVTIEMVLPFFGFDHPSFWTLVNEFRRRIFEEVAASDSPGLIFTYVWSLDDPNDKAFIDSLTAIFKTEDANIFYVELMANLDERVRRNQCESRLAAKPSKRDIGSSHKHLLETEEKYRMNSAGNFFYPERHIQIDNSDLTPAEVTRRILEAFRLRAIQSGNC